MSDDTLNVDSAEELPTDENIGMEDTASQETTEESNEGDEPKGEEKALRDTKAALKEAKSEYTKMKQEIAKMQGALTTLTQLQSQQRQNQQEVEEKDWLDELDDEKVLADPKAALKLMRERERAEFAKVLEMRDRYLESKFKNASSIDPELQSKVDELRNDPDFSDLPDTKLLAMAKKMSIPKKAVMQPRGSISGSRTNTQSSKKAGELTPEQIAWLTVSGAIPSKKRTDTLE